MDDEKTILIALLAALLLLVLGTVVIDAVFRTEVGDIRTTKMETPVYESYELEQLGAVVCTLPADTKVNIRAILTSKDLSQGEQTMFTEILAFKVDSRVGDKECSGFVLREYLKR